MSNMCMHCLEEGDWTDEDKCPSCEAAGHSSPWAVSRCDACNKIYYEAMDRLIKDVKIRQQSPNNAIADLQSRVRKLEDKVKQLEGRSP